MLKREVVDLEDCLLHDLYEQRRYECGQLNLSFPDQRMKEKSWAADELLRRGTERWGRGVAVEYERDPRGPSVSYLKLMPGGPAAEAHGELTGLRLDR